MKKIFTILILSTLFAGELEVDGDLTVTGNIQNQMIDSLLQMIQDLQSQLSDLQVDNRLETRVYQLPRIEFTYGENNTYDLDIHSITGYNLDYATIGIIHVLDYQMNNNDNVDINIQEEYTDHNGDQLHTDSQIKLYNYGGTIKYSHNSNDVDYVTYDYRNDIKLTFHGSDGWVDLLLAITGLFPSDSNIQLQNSGLQIKDKKTEKQ